MFCSNCGARAEGNFCSACGAKLFRPDTAAVAAGPATSPAPAAAAPAAPVDWSAMVDYEALLRIPEVRDLVARHAARTKKMTGEEFLELADKAFEPVPGVSMVKLAAIAQPLGYRLGVKTGKSRSATLQRPAGKVLVSALCSLARHGQKVRQVQQASDGCTIEASLPSDMWALEGDLIVTVRAEPPATHVEASTLIKGQMFDYGKSKRCLDELFSDLEKMPSVM